MAETYDYGPQTRDQAGRRRAERPPGAEGAQDFKEQKRVKGAAGLDVQEQPPSDARGSGGRRLRGVRDTAEAQTRGRRKHTTTSLLTGRAVVRAHRRSGAGATTEKQPTS